MLFLLGRSPLRGHKRDKINKITPNYKYIPYSIQLQTHFI